MSALRHKRPLAATRVHVLEIRISAPSDRDARRTPVTAFAASFRSSLLATF